MKLFNKVLAAVTAATIFLSGAVNSYAADFTTDGSTTIPISATISGSYKITLPASITSIDKNSMGYATVPLNVTSVFTSLAGHGLFITYDMTLTNGTKNYTNKINATDQSGVMLMVDPETSFNTNTITIDGSTVTVNDIDWLFKDIDGSAYPVYMTSARTAGASGAPVVNGVRIPVRDATTYEIVNYEDLSAGNYTGNMSVAWSLHEIQDKYLQ